MRSTYDHDESQDVCAWNLFKMLCVLGVVLCQPTQNLREGLLKDLSQDLILEFYLGIHHGLLEREEAFPNLAWKEKMAHS